MTHLSSYLPLLKRRSVLRLTLTCFVLSLASSSAEAQFFSRFRRQQPTTSRIANSCQYSAKGLRRQVASDGFLVTLDRSLSLSTQQSDRFRQVLDAHWQAEWTNLGVQSAAQGLSAIRNALNDIDPATLRQFLRPSQLTAINNPDQITVQFLQDNPQFVQHLTVEDLLARQQTYFENVSRTKIEELQTLCHLSTSQISELEKGSDLALQVLLAEQRRAFQQVKAADSIEGVTAEAASRLNMPVGLQLSAQRDWLAAVNSAVEPTCLAKYNTRQSVRVAQANHFGAAVVAMRVGKLARLSDGQQAELTKQLLAKSSSQFSSERDFLLQSNSLAQKDMRSIQTAKQWSRFKSVADELLVVHGPIR